MAIPGMTDQEMSVLNLKRFQLLLLRSRISFSSARSLIQSEINVIGISSGYMMTHFLSPSAMVKEKCLFVWFLLA